MSNKITSLLFKNGFRVFGKTKVLATELTLLMTAATTILTATSLENFVLNKSKENIEKNSNSIQYSLFKNDDNSFDAIINKSDVEFNTIPKPDFLDYLNANNNFSNVKDGKYGTTNSLKWLNKDSNKLNFYYVTKPDVNGKNLLKLGPTGELFASLNIESSVNTNSVLSHIGEIFSFIDNTNSELNGIPNNCNESSSFDMRKIIYDSKNNLAVGISDFGYSQVIGFDMNKKISMNHNIVDINNENQYLSQNIANKDGYYAVPNEIIILLGKQDENAKQFYIKNANANNQTWNFSSYGEILSDLGQIINEIGPAPKVNWTPYDLFIDNSVVSNKIRFLNDFLTNQNLNFLVNFINKYNYFDFKISQITQSELENSYLIYNGTDINKKKTLRFLKTVAWFPNYLSNSELNDALNETKTLWLGKVNNFIETIIDPFSLWNDVERDTEYLISAIKKYIYTKSNLINVNNLFNLIIDSISNIKFNVIDLEIFKNILSTNKNKFDDIVENKYATLNTLESYIWIVEEYIDYCLELYLNQKPTASFLFNEYYTIDGIVKRLGFIKNENSNFSINDNESGNTYIFSKRSSDDTLNMIINSHDSKVDIKESSVELNINSYFRAIKNISFWSRVFWHGFGISFDTSMAVTSDGTIAKTKEEYINKNFFKFKNHYVPNYELFVNLNTLDILQKMYSDIEWIVSNSQLNGILKSLYPFSKFRYKDLTKEYYEIKIVPAIYEWFNIWMLKSVSFKGGSLEITGTYFLGVGAPNGTPISGNLFDKTSYTVVVSSNFLENNKYHPKRNPNGKAVFPNYHLFEKASRLPYISYSNTKEEGDWIFNPFTNQIEYYQDFTTWFNSIPEQYKISLNGNKFLITDNGLSADFMYPVANQNMLLVNNKKTAVLYVNNDGYARAIQNSSGAIENKYIGLKFNGQKDNLSNTLNRTKNIEILNEWISKNISNNNYYLAYKVKDSNQPNKLLYTRMNFINNFQKMIIGITMSIAIIVILLTIVFGCTLIRSIIKQNRQMFGVCLANGIDKKTLILSFLPFSLIPGLVSGVFGYLFANLLQPFLLNMVSSYWTLPIVKLNWLWWMFLLIPVIVTILLFFISYLVLVWTLRKSATEILATPSSFRMNGLVEKSNILFKHFRARTAFKFTYIFGNITRFIILMSIVTSFITLSTTTIGSINVFDTALNYTERNKNYQYAFDLYSPTIQGGFYNLTPSNSIGSSNQMLPSLYNESVQETTFYVPNVYSTYNVNQVIYGVEKTIQNWLQNNSIESGNFYVFNTNITNKWIPNAPINSKLKATIKIVNENIFNLSPMSFIDASDNSETNFKIENSIEIVYYQLQQTYDSRIYNNYWINPYKEEKEYFNTYYYPSFDIASKLQKDLKFFSNKIWSKPLLDFDINLGAMSINPWVFAKTMIPSSIINIAEIKSNELVKRSIEFYSYLDKQEIKKSHDKTGINYKNYYDAMLFNKPLFNNQKNSYNPFNIDGSPFEFDLNGNPIFDDTKAIFIPKKSLYNNITSYVLNQDVATKGLPTFELKPETIRLWTYLITNNMNLIYKKWEIENYGKNENLNYSLGVGQVLFNDYYSSEKIINNDSTYTYLNGFFNKINGQITRNDSLKIIGIKSKPYKNNKEPMITLYDSNYPDNKTKTLNGLLNSKLSDGCYPLIINEVASKYFKLFVNDIIDIKITNGLFRFKRIGQEQNPNIKVKFKIVGITSSKSEMQFYTNQDFANEILGYYSNEDNANKMYQNDYEPFNGLFSAITEPSLIMNLAPIYAPLGINPSSPLCVSGAALVGSENSSIIKNSWNELNDILKFDIVKDIPYNSDGVNKVINKIIKIGNMNNELTSYMTITSMITNVDTKFASNVISKTIDSTIQNIQSIAILSLLPTLFIIITLMATMIVSESKRLIAIMKVLGFGDWFNTFNFMFVYIVVLLLGLLLAIPLTYGFLAGLKAIGFGIFNIIINPVAPWWIYLASAGAAGLFFVLLFIIVKAKMKKINLSQAISFGA